MPSTNSLLHPFWCSLKASIHWHWCCFSCDAGWWTAFASFLTLTHLDDGPRFGLGGSNYKFCWYLNLGGTPLELVYIISKINLLNWHCQSPFRSEVSHSCHGPIPGQHTSFKYWYKSFKGAFNKFKDPIQELSRLTYFSVWQLQVKPGQHNSVASWWHQCTWLIFYELLSQFYSGICLRCPPWESLLEHYLDGGMIPKSIAHTWLVLSPSCSYVSFWFVDSFCLALHTRLCHSHELHFMLRDTDQTPPLHESFQQCIAVDQCYVFALCQVPASCQGPQFHNFSLLGET